MADKKVGAHDEGAKTKLGLIGGIMLILGAIWMLYAIFFTPPTEEELKEMRDAAKAAAKKKL